jgi:hypothetical protein
MALTTEEKEIVRVGLSSGKDKGQILAALASYRTQVADEAPKGGYLSRAGSVATGVGKSLIEGPVETAGLLQTVGQGAMSSILGTLDPNKTIGETWQEIRQSTGFQSLQGEQKQKITELLTSQNPDEKAGKVIGFIGQLAGSAPSAVQRGITTGAKSIGSVIARTGEALTPSMPSSSGGILGGVRQTVSELAERVPRFLGRVKEGVDEAAQRAEKIRTSSPQVAQAIKLDLPEKYINFATEADAPTKAAAKRVLDLAEETKKTVGVKTNPGIVGGELAGKQYELIDKQKKLVGSQIGEQIEKLGKSKVRANMAPSFSQIDDVLTQNGISVGENGVLKFTGKFTPAERNRIQELYTLSREAGENLSAIQVRDMDNLFSKLQREARMEGIGDLRVTANGQDMSLFRVFRDVYSNQLENVAPEIRDLNRQYRNLATLTDDIEDSIIKTPNFNITKSTDAAEFAKVNLRRIFGEAQSSPAYEAIADEMDTVARQLGYADAKPKDIAAFAQEIRELFPEATPRTGFTGGIRAGISDIIERVSEIGTPNAQDKIKALRELLGVIE